MISHFPLRCITGKPGNHWFGYYDKLQFDDTGRFVLGMQVNFEGRSPVVDDAITIGMVDLQDNDTWKSIGSSSAWCWQQGCMLQWIPGNKKSAIWNDRVSDRYISRILNVETGERNELPMPVYCLSPDGTTAIAADFRRINVLRPGYGYAGIADPNHGERAPDDSGIWRIDLETGSSELILSIAEIARIPSETGDLTGAMHYFNHLLINPDGTRFEFLHRWRIPASDGSLGGFRTRMITAGLDGKNVRIVDKSGNTSHFIWKDPHHILAYTQPADEEQAFYLFDERTGSYTCELAERENGHCLYLPGNEWILNDTYPQGTERIQHLYLYHVASGRRVPLADFPAPVEYTGEWRCDLHPRLSRDGKLICIDSAHEGGRQLYVMEIGDAISAVR